MAKTAKTGAPVSGEARQGRLQSTCAHCGLCAVVCPAGAIQLVDSGHGRLVPRIDADRCTDCGLCERVCPTLMFPHTHALAGTAPEPLQGAYLAHAMDEQTRFRAASGGVVTALALWWLDSGAGRRALVTLPGRTGPYRLFPEPVVTGEPEDVRAAAGSHYAAASTLVALGGVGRDELEDVLIVGLPCQVRAVRQWAREAGLSPGPLVSLFCAGAKDRRFLLWTLRCMGVAPSQVRHFDMRCGGWPGVSVAELEDGSRRTMRKDAPHPDFAWRNATFAYRACLMCPDPAGEEADIACGDPWTFEKEAGEGANLVYVRTELGGRIWDEAVAAGAIGVVRRVGRSELARRVAGHQMRAQRAQALRWLIMGDGMGDAVARHVRLSAQRVYLRWRLSSTRMVSTLIAALPGWAVRLLKKMRV